MTKGETSRVAEKRVTIILVAYIGCGCAASFGIRRSAMAKTKSLVGWEFGRMGCAYEKIPQIELNTAMIYSTAIR